VVGNGTEWVRVSARAMRSADCVAAARAFYSAFDLLRVEFLAVFCRRFTRSVTQVLGLMRMLQLRTERCWPF